MADAPVKASDVEPETDATVKAEEAWDEYIDGLEVNRYHTVPVDSIKLATFNPRRGSVADAIESLREFGQHRAAVVQKSTREVVVGNHMLKAIHQLGWADVDIYLVDEDDDKALRRAIADNATGDKAKWEEEELAQALERVGSVPGFDDQAVEKLLAKVAKDTGQNDLGEPTYPIVARMNEQYDYVVIIATNATDVAWLETNLQLQSEKSYKSDAVGKSHVLTVARLQEVLER